MAEYLMDNGASSGTAKFSHWWRLFRRREIQ
jgi:hypothetical protein